MIPPFTQFTKLVVKEADIACDPVTSLVSLRSSDNTSEVRFARNDNRAAAFTTRTNTADNQCSQTELTVCLFCKGEQDLARSLEEREQFARDNRVCFGYLQPGHITR